MGRERGKEGSGLGTCFQIFPTQLGFYFLIMYVCLHHGQLSVSFLGTYSDITHSIVPISDCCSCSQEGFPMVLWGPNFLCFTQHSICALHILLTQQIILKMKLFLSLFGSIPNHPFVLHIYICKTYMYVCIYVRHI